MLQLVYQILVVWQRICKTIGWTSIVLPMLVLSKPSAMLLEAFLFPRLAVFRGTLKLVGDPVEYGKVLRTPRNAL